MCIRDRTGTLSGSAAMLVAASALAILTPVLSILGAMSWTAIVKGLVSLAGAFTVIGVAGAVLTPLVPTILGLSGAMALIGVAVLGLGEMCIRDRLSVIHGTCHRRGQGCRVYKWCDSE